LSCHPSEVKVIEGRFADVGIYDERVGVKWIGRKWKIDIGDDA
jgi:hypothetical protein